MAKKIPIDKIADSARRAIKDPAGTAGKVAEHAKGTAVLGRAVAEMVGKAAASKAAQTAGAVAEAARSRRSRAHNPTQAPRAESPAHLRSVPPTPAPSPSSAPRAEPAPPAKRASAKKSAAKKSAAKKAPAKKAATPADVAGVIAKKPPAKKAAKKAPAKKAATHAPAKSSPGDKLPPRKPNPDKVPADRAANDAVPPAENVPSVGFSAARERPYP